MKLGDLPNLLAFAFPVIAGLGYVFEEPWLFLAIAAGWIVLMQILDEVLRHEPAASWQVVGRDTTAPDLRFPVENVVLYVYVLAHVVVVGLGVWQFSRTDDDLAWIVFAFPVALSGVTAIIAAHELLHGSTRLDMLMGRVATTPAFWNVHEYEHLFLHHRDEHICTEADVSASQLGQSCYSYFAKGVVANYRDAWTLQRDALTARGKRNATLRAFAMTHLPPALLAALVAILFGWAALIFFLVQALLSVFLFLAGTYNQHYGLIRRIQPDGRREALSYMNIWSADQRMTNLAFWNIGRHAHHHLDAFRSYTDLKVIEASPLLPHGYFTSLLLALVPPLWFKVMDPRVAEVFVRRDQLAAQGLL